MAGFAAFLAGLEPGDSATWLSVFLGILTTVGAVVVFAQLKTRERRQALTDLHSHLTSGEVAGARDTIGRLLYPTSDGETPASGDSIRAYFTLIWAVQRSRNVFKMNRLPWLTKSQKESVYSRLTRFGARKDAARALTWNLDEIVESVRIVHQDYHSQLELVDTDAWEEFEALMPARLSSTWQR